MIKFDAIMEKNALNSKQVYYKMNKVIINYN